MLVLARSLFLFFSIVDALGQAGPHVNCLFYLFIFFVYCVICFSCLSTVYLIWGNVGLATVGA